MFKLFLQLKFLFPKQTVCINRVVSLSLSLIGPFTVFLLLSCNLTDRNLGDAPVGPRDGLQSGSLDSLAGGWIQDSIATNLRIFATPAIIKAGNQGRAKITVHVIDSKHNPLAGKVVRFAASSGTITAADTSDEEGMASATFTAIPKNGEVRILAATRIGDSQVVVGTSLQLTGLTVHIVPQSSDTLVGESVPLTVSVTDGEGEPVPAAEVKLQGTTSLSGTTDGAGRLHTSVKSSQAGQIKVTAYAQGVGDSLVVGFWNSAPGSHSRTLLLFAEPTRIPATQGETSTIKAILYDDNHNPVAGKVVTFSASQGLIHPTDTTNAQGEAQVQYQGMAVDADASITATYLQGDSLRSVSTTVTSAGLQLKVNPSAQEALVGSSVPVSIRLLDAAGQAMPNVKITLKGSSQTLLSTNSSGIATTLLTSATEQTLLVSASALGASDSAKVVFFKTLPSGSSANKPAVGNLRIFVDRSKLKASNTDVTQVRVVAFDKFNNPLAGRAVRFTATHGIITALDTTDAKGEASVAYRSVPINVDARLTASMTVEDSALAVATTVTLAGLEIDVQPSLHDALLNRQVPVLVRITDGAGNPVPDAKITYNGSPGEGSTDGDGIFHTSITSGTQKRATLTASALGATDSGSVDFWTVLPTKTDNTVGSIRKMRIFSTRSQLRADNSDFSSISVILTNENNNPAVGEAVHFTSDLGIIGESATVDSTGRATVLLHSSPVNGLCRVQATAVGRNLTATTEILFSGVALQLVPNQTDLKIGEAASLEAFLKDASGNPIGGDPVSFTLTGPATFENGNATYQTTLNPNGRALVWVSATGAGTVRVKATALNSTDSIDLRYSNNSLTLVTAKTSLLVGGLDSTLITATYVNGSGNPVAGATIKFATNAGTITKASATTDAGGKASTFLRSAGFAGTANIQATAPEGSALVSVNFVATAAKSIQLTITADNIGINGGIATLKAVVADGEGNMVSGQDVNFRILKGPGGGETITKPVVQSQAGVAQSQLQSGSLASSYRGTLVVATAGNLSDTSKLTISGPAHIITVSRPEDDSVVVANGGKSDETTFEYFVGAVVQDINGNAVADGTEVHFSAAVTGMAVGVRILDHWDGLGSTTTTSVKPVYRTVLDDIPFEDINNNFKIDAGIDLDLDGIPSILRRGEDRNGDGIFDYNPSLHDTWYDLNGNGKCDAGVGENDTVVVAGKTLFADLNGNGIRDPSEIIVDRGTPGVCDLPASGDYPFNTWESRAYLPAMTFQNNEFAVAIEVSAITVNGVAHARLRYPRQFARRLYVNINGEANGIRDRDGERFLLPQIK